MKTVTNRTRIAGAFAGVTAGILALALSASLAAGQDMRAPEVPPDLAVPEGNMVEFHVYAIGVQIYAWSGSAWVFVAPDAVLFEGNGGMVGSHYAGPTWESISGSKVVGRKVQGTTVDPTAIPWLLLVATATDGPGILASTTYIQRVNTVGGLAPATPGAAVADIARVPYAAEYYFFRMAD